MGSRTEFPFATDGGAVKKLLIEEHIMAGMIIVMLVILFVNVVGRYVFNWSVAFTEELVVYLFVCVSMIGAPAACARGANMGLSILTDNVPSSFQKLFLIISALASIILFGFLLYQGIQDFSMMLSIKQKTPILRMPVWVFTAFFPLGSGFYIFRVVQATIRKIKEL